MTRDQNVKIRNEITSLIKSLGDNDCVNVLKKRFEVTHVTLPKAQDLINDNDVQLNEKQLRPFRECLRKLNSALEHTSTGFEVIPIKENAKAPALINFSGGALKTHTQIKNIWKTNPSCNWATTGNNFKGKSLCIIDVDKKNGGLASWEKLKAEHNIPDTRIHNSANGGLHVFFTADEPVSNSVQKLDDGLDVRGFNGYVLLPESKIDNKRYTIESAVAPASLPMSIRSELNTPKPKTKSNEPAKELDDAAVAIERLRAMEWLQSHGPAVEGEGGDLHTFQAAAQMRDLGLPEDVALEVLTLWNEFCEPPWTESEIQQKIDNAYQYSKNEAGSKSIAGMLDDLPIIEETETAEQPTQPPKQNKRKSHSKLHFVADLKLPEKIHREYIWKGHLPKKCLGVLYGPPNEGKSIFAKSLCSHYASSENYFLKDRVGTGGALYVALEGHEGIPYRFTALKKHHSNFEWDSMPVAWMDLFLPLAVTGKDDQMGLQGRIDLENTIEAFKQRYGDYPNIIVLDNLTEVARGDTNGAETIAEINEYAKDLIERFDCTVLYVHHPNKANDKIERGSGHIRASATASLQLSNGVVTDTKQRDYGKGQQHFAIEVVSIGVDQDGDIVDSVVIVPSDGTSSQCALNDVDHARLRVIKELVERNHGDPVKQKLVTDRWDELKLVKGLGERAVRNLHTHYSSDGFIERSGGTNSKVVTLAEKGEMELEFAE